MIRLSTSILGMDFQKNLHNLILTKRKVEKLCKSNTTDSLSDTIMSRLSGLLMKVILLFANIILATLAAAASSVADAENLKNLDYY